ncbi:MAG: hypothetical protein JF590_08710 [Gemmatimonadetes bacterium]|nr:hypothetical protein [Gemmatimonadota bacterium]
MSATEGRRFALTVGLSFITLGGIAWLRGHPLTAPVLAGVGGVLLLAGSVAPARLGPVHRAWMGLAALMSAVTTPLFMGLVYFFVVTPMGLLRRLAGRPSIREHRPAAPTFWVARTDDAARRAGMEHQF